MNRSRFIGMAFVVAGALLTSCAGSPTGGAASGPGEYLEVQFTGSGVNPETARITATGNVHWVNAANEYHGRVVFPESVAKDFTCDDLRPTFLIVPGSLQSIPISQFAPERVTLPCPLRPGTYPYEVWLTGAGFGQESGDPVKKLSGTLVVE